MNKLHHVEIQMSFCKKKKKKKDPPASFPRFLNVTYMGGESPSISKSSCLTGVGVV